MLFYEQPTDPWVPFDFMLLEAYQRLQDEICPRCGHPVWLCRSNSNSVMFKVETGICYAERALKEYELKGMTAKEKKDIPKSAKAKWGQFTYTIPVVPPNIEGELPSREEYMKELAEKANAERSNPI